MDRLLAQGGSLDRAETLAMAAQVADALAFAESRGVLHGDVSPGNLRLDPLGKYHLLDFGLSRCAARERATADAFLGSRRALRRCRRSAGHA